MTVQRERRLRQLAAEQAEQLRKQAEVITALKADLNEMKKGALRKRAAGLGIDEDTLEEADDADDTKAALIELIVAHKEKELKEDRAAKQEVDAKKEEEKQARKKKEKEEVGSLC